MLKTLSAITAVFIHHGPLHVKRQLQLLAEGLRVGHCDSTVLLGPGKVQSGLNASFPCKHIDKVGWRCLRMFSTASGKVLELRLQLYS